MRLLDDITIYHAKEEKHLVLFQGDLTDVPSEYSFDVLVVSAFPDDYTPTPSSLIGTKQTLYRRDYLAMLLLLLDYIELAQCNQVSIGPSNPCPAYKMNENSKIISSGPFKGKKIEFAPTTGIDRFFGISKEFMKKIFDFEPGEYLITDESSLHDFTRLDEMELSDIQIRIQDEYGIDISDIESGNLIEIFTRIYKNRLKAST